MATLEEATLEACNLLDLSAIAKDWADQAWENDFCEPNELPDLLKDIAAEQDYKKGLMKLLAVCRRWRSSTQDSSAEGFWKVLTDNDMSHRVLIAILHSLIEPCDRMSRAGPKLESSVLSANIYMVLVQIPGSGAYKVFHPLLFQKALDVLKLWPQKGNNKRKRQKTPQTDDQQTSGSAGRRAKTRRTAQATQPQDDLDESSDDASDDDDSVQEYGRTVANEAALAKVKDRMVELLQDVVLLLSTFSLRESDQTRHHVIQLLTDMTRIDISSMQTAFLFPPGSQIYNIKSLAQVAYIGLSIISTSLHGEIGSNTRTMFKHLIGSILMTCVSSGASLLKEVQQIKDYTVQFVRHIAAKDCGDSHTVVKVLVQHLCTKCPDKADFRTPVAKAIVDIMKSLPLTCYCSLMKWLLKYSKNAKTGYRIFALDMISLLLAEQERQVEDEVENREECKQLTSKKYLLDIVIGRCSDRAPTVRAKALQCISQCAGTSNESLLNLIKHTLQEPLDKSTDAVPISEGSGCGVKSVGSMIRKRTCDDKVGVRKAGLQALESIIHLDLTTLHKPDLMMLHDRCMDPALSVRRQAMVSLTSLLQEQPSSTILHSFWLDGILPLVLDRETTAQEKCYHILEDVILNCIVPLHRSIEERHTLAWRLLHIVANPAGQEVRRYLHNACNYWAKQGKLTNNVVKALTSHVNSDHNKATWLVLSQMAGASTKIDHNFVIKCWKEYTTNKHECDDKTLGWVLSVLGSVSGQLPEGAVTSLTEDLQQKLSSFGCTPDIIAAIIGTVCKLCQAQPQAKDMIDFWCSDLLKSSEQFLSNVVLNPESGSSINDNMLVKHLFTVGEVAQLAPCRTTERLFMLVESILISQANKSTDAGAPLQKCELSPTVQAHAFVTLGKLCLQNENLAKKCIAALARELETSDNAAIRNNVVVVMCDLCVRYTSLVDRYIPNIATCLRDSAPLVRRQTLTLLTHLLQEDYVKWKGSLFYHFITSLVDENEDIRKFADFCFVHLLLSRHPGMFYQHFVQCIFHFNCYENHKVFNKFPQTEREKKLFSLKGDGNTSKRSSLYQFLLAHMSDENKFQLMGKLCQEVLGGITDGAIPLDQESGALLKDTLVILSSKGIKLSSMRSKAADDMADEGDAAGVAIVQARTKFLTQVLKKNMIENIIPIIIELKHMLEKHRSPLLGDLLVYLKEVMKDYRNEVQDVLSVDRQLANEIEFDLRKYDEQQKELAEQQRRQRNTPQSYRNTSGGLGEREMAIETRARRSPAHGCRPSSSAALNSPGHQSGNFLTPQLRSANSSAASTGSNRKTPATPGQNMAGAAKTPAQIRRHTLATAAILKSACKAIDEARKVTDDRRRKSVMEALNTQTPEMPKRGDRDSGQRRSPIGRTPLGQQNVNSAAKLNVGDENGEQWSDSEERDSFKTPLRPNRAASTPEGNDSHLSRITFCINASAIVPTSPIPTSLPIRVYPKNKSAHPSWISKVGVAEDGEEKEQEVICLPSPEQRLPKPRTWNVKSPDRQNVPHTTRKSGHNDSIAQRTRSRKTSRKR